MATVNQENLSEERALELSLAGFDEFTGDDSTFTIHDIPDGALLSAGTDNGDGSWTLARDEFDGLTIQVPLDIQGSYEPNFDVIARRDNDESSISRVAQARVSGDSDGGSWVSSPGSEQTVSFRVSGEHFEGPPQFALIINGEQFGDIYTVDADHRQGQWEDISVSGDFGGARVDSVEIKFLNDHWGGHWTKDRNLLVDSVEINGNELSVEDASYARGWGDPIAGQTRMAWGGSMSWNTESLSAGVSGEEDTPIALELTATPPPGMEDYDVESITIGNVPDGAMLSAGTDNGDGTWTVAPAALAGLTLTPPANSDADFELSITTTGLNGETGERITSDSQLNVKVTAAADSPDVSVSTAAGDEDTAISLNIDATTSDLDGSESISSIVIDNVPDGAMLSAGTQYNDGSWVLQAGDLDGLTVTPPEHSDEDFNLTVSVTATEADGGASATSVAVLPVTVNADADAPIVHNPADESVVTFRLSGEHVSEMGGFSGPPEFFIYIDGEQVGGRHFATADISLGQWEDISVRGDWGPAGPQQVEIEFTNDLWCQPNCQDRDLIVDRIDVNATPYESEDALYLRYAMHGDDARDFCPPGVDPVEYFQNNPEEYATFREEVLLPGRERMSWNGRLIYDTADNGGPQGAIGDEDQPIELHLEAALVDVDGSETLSDVTIAGVPGGATLSAGTDNGDGSWTLSPDELQGLTITPPADSDADFSLAVTVSSTEADGGDTASTTIDLPVIVRAVADTPTITGPGALTGNENAPVAIDVQAGLADIDGSESLAVVFSDVPDGALLSTGVRNEDGTWTVPAANLVGLTVTPPPGSDADFTLTATAVATEAENGDEASSSIEIPITVEAVASTPTLDVSAASGYEDTSIGLDITASIADTDGSETVTVTISDVPDGARLSGGRDNGDGTWTLTQENLRGLNITPAPDSDEDFTLSVAVTSTEASNGDSRTVVADLLVNVDAVADGAAIVGADDSMLSTVSLQVSGRDFEGSPQFRLLIDGEQVGGVHTITADRWQDQWQTIELSGDWGPDGPQSVEIDYINDVWGGHWTMDRNLYVDNVTINGHEYGPETAAYERDWMSEIDGQEMMAWGGSLVFDTSDNPGPTARATNEDQAIALDIDVALIDTDGSEAIVDPVVIAGVPDGAVLSAGELQADGSWHVDATDVPALTLTPAEHSDTDIQLNVTVTTEEAENGDRATRSADVSITVNAVADAPTVAANDVAGREDEFTALDVSSALVDVDGSENLSVVISGLPDGAELNVGTNNGDGSWTLTPDQLDSVAVRPPNNFSGSFELDVEAISTEAANDDQASTTTAFTVTVDAVADAAQITRKTAKVSEDGTANLKITVATTDDSETVGDILITKMPDGATLSAGIDNGDGTWTLRPDELDGLQVSPPADSNDNFRLTIKAETIDENGDSRTTNKNVWVKITGVADAPDAGAANVSGDEDQPIAINASAALVDVDGSETLGIEISGVPYGSRMSHGVDQGNGVWTIAPEDLGSLTIQAPRNFSGSIDLNLTATATENDGDSAVTVVPFSVDVRGVADTPTMEVRPASGLEDNAIALDIRPALTDTDGSETLALTIAGVPDGAQLSAGTQEEDGSWTIAADEVAGLAVTPPPDSNVDFTLTVTARATEADGDVTTSTTMALPVTVRGVADTPIAQADDVRGFEDTVIPLSLSGAVADTDGSEQVSIVLSGLPGGARLSHGLYNGNGTWSINPDDLDVITFTPPEDWSGTVTMNMKVISTEDDGHATSVNLPFNIEVVGVVDTPNGFKAANGLEDTAIGLNLNPGLNDIDGSESLTGAVITGLPDGAVLSAGTETSPGVFTLTPDEFDGLTVTPPYNSNENFALNVSVTIREADGHEIQYASPLNVNVRGVADQPLIAADDISGNYGEPIAADFQGTLTDTDGSETLYYIVEDVPNGTYLSNGYNNGDGTWTVLESQLDGLTITPPEDLSGTMSLTVRAVARENDGDINHNAADFEVEVVGTATGGGGGGGNDTQNIVLANTRGDEDTAIDINLGVLIAAEVDTVTISQVPDGASLSAGVDGGDGTWTLTRADLTGLTITAPEHSDTNFSLDVVWEGGIHDGALGSDTIAVNVTAVADAPTLTVQSMDGSEDTPVTLAFGGELVDQDGSEQLSYVVKDLPAGATLNQGFLNPVSGVWTLEPGDLVDLQVTPPADFSGELGFTIGAVATEGNGHFAVTNQLVSIPIEAVADGANISASPDAGTEDQAIALNLSASGADADGSESVTAVVISNLPDGALLTGAVDNGDGTWSVAPDEIGSVAVIPPPNAHGSFSLTVSATTAEANGSEATSSKNVSFSVASDPDAPNVSANSVAGSEDSPIALDLSGALIDTDGSEVMSVVIGGIPDGAVLSAGFNNGDGTWSMTPDQLDGITVTPPQNFAGSLALTITGVSLEMDTGDTATTTPVAFSVDVAGVADSPSIDALAASGFEDMPIPIVLNATLSDTDGSETLSATFTGVPDGASFSAGVRNEDGSWTVSGSDFDGLLLTPPSHSDVDFELQVALTSTDLGGDEATVLDTVPVRLTGVADEAAISAGDVLGAEDSAVALDLSAALVDADGSESLAVYVTGVPLTASLSAGTRGESGEWIVTPDQLDGLTLLPPENFDGRLDLSLMAVTTEGSGSSAVITRDFSVTIDAAADAPSLTVVDAAGIEDEPLPLSVGAVLTDVDGSESLAVVVSGLPAGAVLSAGTVDDDGNWTLAPDQLSGLTMTPPANFSGDLTLTVTALATEENGDQASTNANINVSIAPQVDGANVAAEDVAGIEDQAIALNLSAALMDTDGSEQLTLQVSGIPDDASLSAGTALGNGIWQLLPAELDGLTLTPSPDMHGTVNLSMTATVTESDGSQSVVSKAFNVDVAADADAPVLTAADAAGDAGTVIPLNVQAALTDLDGSESLSLTVRGIPDGVTLNAGARQEDGSWLVGSAHGLAGLALVAGSDVSGNFPLVFEATATDAGGDQATEQVDVNVAIAPPPADPIPAYVPSPVTLDIQTVLENFDGTEDVTVTISGVPDGATLSEGTDNGDGTWTLTDPNATGIEFTPSVDLFGPVSLGLEAVAVQSDGQQATATSSVDFEIAVPDASAAEFAGTDGADVLQGNDGDNVIVGGAGDDLLSGGAGNDAVFGGDGNDRFMFGLGDDHAVFVGGPGQDVVQLSGMNTGPVDALQNPGDWMVALDNGNTGFTTADNALNFEGQASGTIQLSDGSELEFHNVSSLEW